MKKLIFILFAINCFAQAPSIQWQKSYGGSIQDYGQYMRKTNDGGYILIGDALSTDGDFIGSTGFASNALIIKTDSNGNIEWKKDIGGSQNDSAYRVITTSDNGYIVACNTYSNNGQVTGNHGEIDIWLVKLNSTGTILWSKTYGCSNYDGISGIIQTSDGGYVFAGNSTVNNGDVTGNHGSNDLWIVKIDSAGTIIWQKSYGGTNYDFANDIKQTTDGGFILCGASTSSNFDVTLNQGSYDFWVIKLNSTGNLIWQKTFGGSQHDEAYSVLQTNEGGYIVAGQTASNNGDVTGNLGQFDCWVVKLTANGTVSWKKCYGGFLSDCAMEIIKSDDGGYIIAGETKSTDGFFATNQGLCDAYIFKINSIGTLVWQKLFGGSNNDYLRSIEVTTDGGYIVCGTSSSNDVDITNNHGLEDFWAIKLGIGLLAIDDFDQTKLMICPNPVVDLLNLQIKDNLSIDKIVITDILGKIILQQTENVNTINTQNLTKGIYIIKVFSTEAIYQSKFIKV
jgi:hypothetical protein